jgi:CRISPR/Cas system-associated protein Cas5 (RAMP superfamily)
LAEAKGIKLIASGGISLLMSYQITELGWSELLVKQIYEGRIIETIEKKLYNKIDYSAKKTKKTQESPRFFVYLLRNLASLWCNNYKKNVNKRIIPCLDIKKNGISVKDVDVLLQNGADKVSINSSAVKNPQLINDLAKIWKPMCCSSNWC